jgi:hypothetical protein
MPLPAPRRTPPSLPVASCRTSLVFTYFDTPEVRCFRPHEVRKVNAQYEGNIGLTVHPS